MAGAPSTLLSWIKPEVDYALKLVRDSIAKFSAAPEDAAVLQVCPGQLHQVSGALRIVGLTGATRFCETLEGTFTKVISARPTRSTIETVDRAVLALKDYFDDLMRGQGNVPLRLFPAYRELGTLQGKPEFSEKDLFFPDLELKAPGHPSPRVISLDKFPMYLQEQRTRFQRGLLAALRNQPDGMKEMQAALDAMHQIAPQLPEPRALWWVAPGLVDGLLKVKDPEWLASAKPLCNKLDVQMREIARGKNKDADLFLRELLYVIAKCKPVTPRLKEIKQFYQLDSLFPESDLAGTMEFDMDWLLPALADARSRLEALKGVWVQYISGEPASAARFRDLLASFKAKANDLGNKYLIKLLDAILLVSSRLPDPYPKTSQIMIIEMASAFLLVENVIDHFTDPPADLDQQIGIMGGWLLDAAQGKSSGEPPSGLRPDLNQQIGTLQLRAQVSREILANLAHVEQALDAFARDPAKRTGLTALQPYLRQIHGALFVLRFERVAEAVKLCEGMIAECAKPDHAQAAADMDWIAEGLSSVGFFLDPCLHGREPAEQAIALFFDRFQKRDTPSAEPSPAQPPASATPAVEEVLALAEELLADFEPSEPAAQAVAVADAQPTAEVAEPAVPVAMEAAGSEAATAPQPAVDPEILAIFLEEAGEVLTNIETALSACREQPRNFDELTTIRRGFHTLKGSGRMAGLTDLGEVAWEIEQVMNRWLEKQEPATPGLLELITTASVSFSGWIGQLRENKPLTLDAQHIVDLARRLKAGEEPATAVAPAATTEPAVPVAEPPQPPETAAPAASTPQPEPEEVAIGGIRLTRSFFEIYAKEAVGHVAALESECAAWRNKLGEEATHEFLRAAHTLASSSRTAGFIDIADLAGAVEHWMPFARQVLHESDAKAVQAAIGKLREMVDAVTLRKPPGAATKEVRRVQDLTARLQAAPPPPIETKTSPVAAPVAAAPKSPSPPATPKSPSPPAAAAPAAKGKELRTMRDDIDVQLLPIFLEEAEELLPHIGSDLRDLKANPADPKISQSLMRVLHTFKGSARMAGAIRLGELTHLMESRVEAAVETNQFTAELFEDLESKMDRLSLDLERMRSGEAAPDTQPAAAPADAGPREAPPRVEPPQLSAAAMLRVNADTLDHLINESGEVSIARSRIEAELRVVKQSLSDLNDSIARLRNQLREVEIQAESQMQSRAAVTEERNRDYDPLEFDRYTRLQELTRMMAESLHDVTAIQQTLLKNVGETDAALLQQARTSRDVQQELMRMRAVPFSNLNERLYRIVRQVSRELDKKAELEIEGSQVELDRSVLEKIGAPLEHLLRNALGHGLELPAQRIAEGKPETGRITITLRQESNEIALILSDDGAGLDLGALRRKALEKGLLESGSEPTEAELMQLVFASGLSTTETVTALSGRGIGMDVVRSEIATIGGRVDIASTRGKGTTFTLYLPLTLAVTQAVLVRAGGSVLAISSAMVEQVLRLKTDVLTGIYEKKTIESQSRTYPLHYIQHLLGGSGAAAIQNYNSVLLLRSGIQRIALHVDELFGNQEIVVKNIGPQLARVPGIAGATVLADGQIVLIVNPVQLALRLRASQVQSVPEPEIVKSAAPVVMVVDDSLTVRKITSRMLEREGYQVLTAKDGVDALEQLRNTLPDTMLVDIEMPRMDGFELTKNLRSDPRLQKIPVIIISSRIADKHREHAMQLGVNDFLGKPYQESDLLERIAGFVAEKKKQPAPH